jgi:hypothetical protein
MYGLDTMGIKTAASAACASGPACHPRLAGPKQAKTRNRQRPETGKDVDDQHKTNHNRIVVITLHVLLSEARSA